MNPNVFSTIWDRGGPGIGLLADASGVLILLAAAFLVFRTFRERYLLAWILGWVFYLAYRVSTSMVSLYPARAWLHGVSQDAYVCAIALFVAAILCYTGPVKACIVPLGVGAAGVTLATVRALWWPASSLLLFLLWVTCFALALGGAIKLAIFSRGRRQVGPWVLIAMLLLLHMDQDTTSPHTLAGLDTAIELLLGVSMLVIVLDDSKQRANRLRAVNVISGALAASQEHSAFLLTALEQLKHLVGAKAAWFRILDGTTMILSQQVGLSEDFIRERAAMDVRTSDGARLVQQEQPTIIRIPSLEERNQALVRDEGFDHILMVPVRGKNSVIGSIALGQSRSRSYPQDELDFLAGAGHQVGMAVENLRLMEEIIRSHRQWISTFDSIEDMVLVHDAEYRILKLNRALAQRLGGNIADVVYHRCDQALPGAGTGWQHCPYCDQARTNFAEAPDSCFGGYSVVSTSSFTEAGANRGTIHVIRDTSERRAAEERYRLLFEQVQEGVFLSTPEGRILDCNQAFVRMLGYDRREEVLALDVARDMYLSVAQRQAFCAAMNERGFVRNYEVDLLRKDGAILHALENSFATRDASGNAERYQGFLLDVTDKRRAEDAMRRRNRELHALNAIAVTTAQSFDLDEILNTALRHAIDIFGADTGAVYLLDNSNLLHCRAGYGRRLGSAYTSLELPLDFLQRIRDSRAEVLTEADAGDLPQAITSLVSSEGLRHWIWVVMRANDVAIGALCIATREQHEFTDSDRHLMAAIARQLATTVEKVRLYEETCRAYDNLRRTQEQLLQSEKMSAIGQLISGVAHEINNPLTAILGYAQLLESEELSERARDFVAKLFKQAQRTQRLVQNLLSFARQRKPEKKQVDIRKVLDDTLALRDFDFNLRNIIVHCDIAPDLPAVVADAHQMEQVFLNIINNAVDAMLERDRGGTLTVRACLQGDRVCIDFRDSGAGIREPNKVFDPFYTTKGVGKGTGLGLSICYGIVKEHGGDILALNYSTGGALFRVLLPAANSVALEAPAPASDHVPPLRGRVLLVDDEEAVLEFEREALTGAGAQVVSVSSGEQAIQRLQLEKFDIVLVDSTMPGACSSVGLYRWIAAHLPGTEKNIIFTVSDISDTETAAFLKQASVPYIVKPFQVADLIAATRSLLPKSAKAAAAH